MLLIYFPFPLKLVITLYHKQNNNTQKQNTTTTTNTHPPTNKLHLRNRNLANKKRHATNKKNLTEQHTKNIIQAQTKQTDNEATQQKKITRK
jgi:hypothetical protein